MQAIHMTQRPGIFEHPRGFTPILTLELATGLVELALRSLPVIEMPRGIKPAQHCFDLFHRLLGLRRFIKKPLRFVPGAPGMARHPSRVLPATLGLGQFRIRVDRRLDLTLDAVPQSL
jgi:hypothetical protein